MYSKPKSRTLLILAVFLVMASVSMAVLATPAQISNHSLNQPTRAPQIISPAQITGNTQLGIDCGLGTTSQVNNATSFPVAPSENGASEILTSCQWAGDVSGVADGTI